MKNNVPETDDIIPPGSDSDLDAVDAFIRDVQSRIMRRCARIPEDGRITIQVVRDFEWSANWAESLVASLEYDSVAQTGNDQRLPMLHTPEQIRELYRDENRLSTAGVSQVLDPIERVQVIERLKHFHLESYDDTALDALFEACNWVIMESITQENCMKELATAEDSVHRAELFMMMGNDVEAYREFQKISSEEISNPENALALVELVERYDSARAALKVLKRWFLLEIVLHPLPFDLIQDLIPERKITEPAPRVRYLQSILLHAHQMTPEDLQRQLILVLPQKITLTPQLADVNLRLRKFGLSMNRLDLILDETAPVNLYSMLNSLSEQLIHAADLARSINKNKFAIKALERAVLTNFVIISLIDQPDLDPDDLEFSDPGMTRRIVTETLDEIEELLEEILIFIDSDVQHHLLGVQIAALRRHLARQGTEKILEKSDGLSGLP